jgi:hypothetical protein
MYYWYKMALFDETPEDKRNTYFFQIFKVDPLSVVLNHNEPGPKGPMSHGKGLMQKNDEL